MKVHTCSVFLITSSCLIKIILKCMYVSILPTVRCIDRVTDLESGRALLTRQLCWRTTLISSKFTDKQCLVHIIKSMVLMCVGILSLYKRLLTLGACARVTVLATVLAYVFT